MKKVLSVVLAIMLIAATLPLAFASETIIMPHEKITVTVSDANNSVLKFVPEETKIYIVTSYADDSIDPYVAIYDATCDETHEIDDGNEYNFCEKYEFEAGHEYYLTVAVYSEEEVSFEVELACDHDFAADTCVDCGLICDHEIDLAEFPACLCRQNAECFGLALGETSNTETDGINPVWFSFTPAEDVTAVFYSNVSDGDFDVFGVVYNCDGEEIASDDDFVDTDFVIFCEFTAGETYYLKAESYSGAHALEVSLVEAKHSTDNGEKHDVIYAEATDGTCQEIVYTAGVFCEECDAFIFGHEENGNGSCVDEDGNRFCDCCGNFIMPDLLDIFFFLAEYVDLEVLMKLYDFAMRIINFFSSVFPFQLSDIGLFN